MVESAANGVQRPRIIMTPLNLFFFIVLAIILCPVPANGQGDVSVSDYPSDSGSPGNMDGYDISRVVNESNIILASIVLPDEPSKREDLLLIGEVAISSVLKRLEDLSMDDQSGKDGIDLVESHDLALIYSEMSHSLGTERIPIILARLKFPPIGNLSEEKAMINGTTIRENLFTPSQPNLIVVEFSNGKKESSAGGDVIWT